MGNVAPRLFSLILLLLTKPSWKVADLAKELGVSGRTVHRYMGMLQEIGIPIFSERGPYGGFSLMRGYKLPPLIFTAEEATVLYMGANLMRDVWGRTYGDAVTAVTAKLDNVLPDDLREEVSRTQQSLVVGGLTRSNQHLWEPNIHTLRRCIGERRCVRLRYRSFSDQDSERTLEPYGLTLQWGWWYLVGFCRLRQGMRTFRVDRIQELTALEDQFTVPRNFSVREYLASNMSFEPAYTVVVEIDASIARMVRERHSHWMETTSHPDGSLTVRFGVAGLDWALGWVLGCGSAAKVLEPAELVERVRSAAQGIVQRYTESVEVSSTPQDAFVSAEPGK